MKTPIIKPNFAMAVTCPQCGHSHAQVQMLMVRGRAQCPRCGHTIPSTIPSMTASEYELNVRGC